MQDSQSRRQEIYDKIKGSSKQEYILKEMIRLGFWNDGNVDFEKVNTYFKEERELSKELNDLLKEKQILENPEAFLAAKHKERKQASKQKQKETKEKNEKLRQEKAEKWKQTKASDIIYLGEGFSHQLNQKTSDEARLQKNGFPIIHNAEQLAAKMNISVNELRFLSFSRKNSKVTHYNRFHIAKKSGGVRLISAPKPKLKKAQHWILEEVLDKADIHNKAHGCIKGKSIKTNAAPHVSKAIVINQDLKNFFPSISYKRIKGVFSSFGYSDQVATILALLCSEPKILDISVLGENYFAQRGERFLPQGSPCSPAISNILCKRLDYRLEGIAKKYGFEYTRYVDDLTFSTNDKKTTAIPSILKYSKKIVQEENLNLHPDKLRIMHTGVRQEVTGVVVNEKLNINKAALKRFRALLFQIEKDGIQGKAWNGRGNVLAQIHGYANFIYQIDPEKGTKYKEQVNRILDKYEYKENHSKKYRKSKPKKKGIFNYIASLFKKKK
ncbi:reverse transcriptase family protein [Wenyingzhuangia sp. IMCC45574]